MEVTAQPSFSFNDHYSWLTIQLSFNLGQTAPSLSQSSRKSSGHLHGVVAMAAKASVAAVEVGGWVYKGVSIFNFLPRIPNCDCFLTLQSQLAGIPSDQRQERTNEALTVCGLSSSSSFNCFSLPYTPFSNCPVPHWSFRLLQSTETSMLWSISSNVGGSEMKTLQSHWYIYYNLVSTSPDICLDLFDYYLSRSMFSAPLSVLLVCFWFFFFEVLDYSVYDYYFHASIFEQLPSSPLPLVVHRSAGASTKYRSNASICAAAGRGHDHVVSLLLDHKADLHSHKSVQWMLFLRLWNYIRTFVSPGLELVDFETFWPSSEAPLSAACLNGHVSVVTTLLDHGADPFVRNGYPLKIAAEVRGGGYYLNEWITK